MTGARRPPSSPILRGINCKGARDRRPQCSIRIVYVPRKDQPSQPRKIAKTIELLVTCIAIVWQWNGHEQHDTMPRLPFLDGVNSHAFIVIFGCPCATQNWLGEGLLPANLLQRKVGLGVPIVVRFRMHLDRGSWGWHHNPSMTLNMMAMNLLAPLLVKLRERELIELGRLGSAEALVPAPPGWKISTPRFANQGTQ